MTFEARVQIGGEEVVGQDVLLGHVPIRLDMAARHVTVGEIRRTRVTCGRRASLQVEAVHRLARIVDRLDRLGEAVDDVVAGSELLVSVSLTLVPL